MNIISKVSFKQIMFLAIFFRLLAAIFSKGFAFLDDHFEIIEMANKVVLHEPLAATGEVYIFSLLYPFLHVIIIWICNFIGFTDPEIQMLATRLVHAAVSLVTVFCAYRITNKLTKDENIAKIVALSMAVFWIFPFMCVRNLREFFCVPFIFLAYDYLINNDGKISKISHVLLASFLFALAFDIRYQIVFIPLGIGLVLLCSKTNSLKAIYFGIGFLVSVCITQLLFDWFYWGDPLASLMAYSDYNAKNSHLYPQGDWFMYILTVGGVLLAPACFLIFIGYFKVWKKYLILFLPSLLFFVFHSYFPNKQERFILPFIPMILMLGLIGFNEFYIENNQKNWVKKLTKGLVIWFVVLNTIGLIVFTFTYTKRSRVESMVYLYQKGDVVNIIEDSEGGLPYLPIFYLGKSINYYEINNDKSAIDLQNEIKLGLKPKPNYIIFTGSDNLAIRLNKIKTIYPNLKHEIDIEPSFVDNIAFVLNPKHNVNETWFIYKITENNF